jgi:type IV secretion system protein VirB8
MFGPKKDPKLQTAEAEGLTPQQRHYGRAIGWEDSIASLQALSEKRAWRIVGILAVCVVAEAAAIAMMMPLKENTPYVWMVDRETGRPDLMTAVDTQKISFSDANDKYWLSQYVQARETYDWYTIQKDYDTVGLLSSTEVGAAYAKLFEGDNAIDKRNGSAIRETVKILSVVPNGKNIGTVRFLKTSQRVADAGSQGTSQVWVATIGYEFKPGTYGRESTKLINPFGFRVTSYRADPELPGGAQ